MHINRLLVGGPYRWMPDALSTICKPYVNVAAANCDLEALALAIKLRVICSNTLPWEVDCSRVCSIDRSHGEAWRDNLTLLQAAAEAATSAWSGPRALI